MMPKLERVAHMLKWARVEEFCPSWYAGTEPPPHGRAWLANAFLASGAIQSQGQDVFGVVGAPPCAGAFEALLDEMAMGALDPAGA
ncbi:MAG: hypothetical protein LBF93_13385, partial [Zoogloeaceae bacterium]|nr:hypothetical protein [Zoogloeaceae bacterium]